MWQGVVRVRSAEGSGDADVWGSFFRPSALPHKCHCYQIPQTINQPSLPLLLLQPFKDTLRWRVNLKCPGAGKAPPPLLCPGLPAFFWRSHASCVIPRFYNTHGWHQWRTTASRLLLAVYLEMKGGVRGLDARYHSAPWGYRSWSVSRSGWPPLTGGLNPLAKQALWEGDVLFYCLLFIFLREILIWDLTL